MSRLHRNTRLCSALLVIFVLLGLLPASAQQTPSGNSSPVSILFTVVDKQSKQFVKTLSKEDVRVLEDGVPQEITDFKQQTDTPLSIVIMLDMSVSQERVIPMAKKVSREFVDSIIRPGKDSVGIITFSEEAKLEQELTGDLQQVRQAIKRIEFEPPPGYSGRGMVVTSKTPKPGTAQALQGSTAIWDTVGFASEKFGAQSSADARRVIILITDGDDTSSRLKLSEAAEVAIKFGVVIYSIGIGDEYYSGTIEGELRKISERTGGRAFSPKKLKDIWPAFAEIKQQLHFQYSISFTPSRSKPNGKMRKIKIEIVNPELRKQGLQLSYQQGYFTRG